VLAAVVSAIALGASPTVSAPIHFSLPQPEPTTSTPPQGAWDGTAFQLEVVISSGVELNRLTASGARLDGFGLPLSDPGAWGPVIGCRPGECLVADSQNGWRVSGSVAKAGPTRLLDGGNALAVDWNGAEYVMLWQESASGGLFHLSRFDSSATPLDGPGGTLLPHPLMYLGYEGLSCLQGQCLAAWQDQSAGVTVLALRAVRYAAGALLDATPLTVTNNPGSLDPFGVANDGTQYLLAWTEEISADGGTPHIRAGRVTQQGALLDGAGLVLGKEGGAMAGTCAAFDGVAFRVAWFDALATQVDIARVSSAGVVDPSPAIVHPLTGTTMYDLTCMSGPQGALVTFRASYPPALLVPFGVFLPPDGGVSAPSPVGFGVPTQSGPTLAGTDAGLALAWTESSPNTSRIRGVALGPAGLGADVELVPSASFAGLPSVSCAGSSCVLGWAEGSQGPTFDTLRAGLVSPEPTALNTSATLAAPDAGLFPIQVVASQVNAAWKVFAFNDTFSGVPSGPFVLGSGSLASDGAVSALWAGLPDVWGDTVSAGQLALAQGGGHLWLSYVMAAGDGHGYAALQSYPLSQPSTADAWTRSRANILVSAAAFDFGVSGPLALVNGGPDGGTGTFANVVSDAGTILLSTRIALDTALAVASDGQRQLAVGQDDDGGTLRILAQELSGDGVPAGAPFVLYSMVSQTLPDLTAAALAPGAFAIAWSESDPSTPLGSRRIALGLVSLSGLAEGALCKVPIDCASFVCSSGQCAPAPAGGLTVYPGLRDPDGGVPLDGGVTPGDGGVSIPDGGVLLPDGGVLLPDGGVLEPDGGVLRPDGGVVPPEGGEPRTLRLGCGCSGTGDLAAWLFALLAALWLRTLWSAVRKSR
jgi:hypothetical protein